MYMKSTQLSPTKYSPGRERENPKVDEEVSVNCSTLTAVKEVYGEPTVITESKIVFYSPFI